MSFERAKKINRDLTKDDLLNYRLNQNLRLRKANLEDNLIKKRLCSTNEKKTENKGIKENKEKENFIQKINSNNSANLESSGIEDICKQSVSYAAHDIENYSKLLFSNDKNKFIEGLILLRKCSSVSINPPLLRLIESGAVNKVLAVLENLSQLECQIEHSQSNDLILNESLWLLTNISYGDFCQYLFENKIIQILKNIFPMMKSEEATIQCLVLISNLSCDRNKNIRDSMIKFDFLNFFKQSLKSDSPKVKRECLSTFSSLFIDTPRIPYSLKEDFEYIISDSKNILLEYKVKASTDNIISSCMEFLYLLTFSNTWLMDKLINEAVIIYLVNFLKIEKEDLSQMLQSMRLIGNLTIDDRATSIMVSNGILPLMKGILFSQSKACQAEIIREVLFILSNITAGNEAHSNLFFEEKGLLESVFNVAHIKQLSHDVMFCLSNITVCLDRHRLINMLRNTYMELLANGLKSNKFSIAMLSLEAFENVIRFSEGQYDDKTLQSLVYLDCLKYDIKELIENLSMSNNNKVCEMASELLTEFFSEDYELRLKEDLQYSEIISSIGYDNFINSNQHTPMKQNKREGVFNKSS